MGSSGEQDVMLHRDYGCLKRFRRRRLLSFLRLNSLSATFDSLNNETGAFFDVRFLQRLVEEGRYDEANGYMRRFLPSLDQMEVEARTATRLIGLLKVLDDLAHGNPAGARFVELLARRIDARPSIMDADPHCTEVIRTIFHVHTHPELRDTLDWQIVRKRVGDKVRYLIEQDPVLTDLMRLPRCPTNPYCTIPFGPGLRTRRRHQAKNTGRIPASLLARRFRPKKRRSPSARDLGLSLKPMCWVESMIDEALVDGEKEKAEEHWLEYSCGALVDGEKEKAEEHSLEYSYGEGFAVAPVAPSPGENYGMSCPNAGTKRASQEDDYSVSVGDAKRPRTTGEFCQEAGLRFRFTDMKSASGPEKTYVQSCKALETQVQSPVAQVVMKTK
ncbi:unnamed protein product [Urochloa humidicola]